MTQAHNPPVADPSHQHSTKHRTDVESAVIRFSGDSGDGMQLTGTQFSNTSATLGNDLATFPDFPAEIRAPAGTTFGVSGFQVNLAARDVYTPGDEPDVLVAMNPAALKVNLPDLKTGGLLIINRDAFTKANIERAGYDHNPLEDSSLSRYRLITVDVTTQVETALRDLGLSFKEVARAKNFWTLGLIYYLYSRPLEPTLRYIEDKFSAKPVIAEGNRIALKAGYLYGENAEIIEEVYQIGPAKLAPGLYRTINGNQAAAWGALVASKKSGVPLFYGSYPITPASDILHELSHFKSFDVSTFQAEDEIAAIGATIGAAFAGQLAVTGSSGPGIALKSEAIGLAVGVELPLVIINVQRGGPSTGLPTKTEQADLNQALFGRNGECPVAVVAAATPSDCFQMTFEACRIALKYMTPIFVLTDGYLANGSEPWMIPKIESLPTIATKFWTEQKGFQPFMRDPTTLARVWAVPGTPGLEHRIGGLEKDFNTGHISYDPQNHERMIHVRQEKIDNIANDIPDLEVFGAEQGGKLLVLSWGSTYGSVRQAVQTGRSQGLDVSHAQLRYLNPLPKNTEEVLRRFDKVLVPELNLGQLAFYLRGKFLLPVVGLNKIQGKPFRVDEILDRIKEMLGK